MPAAEYFSRLASFSPCSSFAILNLVLAPSKAIAAAIEKLAVDRPLREKLAALAKDRMREVFSISNMVAATKDLYERILS